MEVNYRELVEAILRETRSAPQARIHQLGDYIELVKLLENVAESHLFVVTFDSQDIAVDHQRNVSYRGSFRVDSVIMPCVVSYLETYFSWFGNACNVYVLGDSVSIFHMTDSFSVSHILKTNLHDISIPTRYLVGCYPHLDPQGTVRAMFTVNAYTNDCLSLNAVLAILKHVDPASVLMVRRVNRLGFGGSKSMQGYFSKFGRVIRIFMLPLKSRKKNISLPPKTGFLVMESPAQCARILAHGQEHLVLPGVTVSVDTFTHRGLVSIGHEGNIYDTL